MLLEGLEEQFDLPTVLVDDGDGGRPKRKLVGQKDQDFFFLRVPPLHPTQETGASLQRPCPCKANDLVLQHLPMLRHRTLVHHP